MIKWHDTAEKAVADHYVPLDTWRGFTLHCTAARQKDKPQAKEVQLWHEMRFGSTWGMGYHFLIEGDGKIATGRRWQAQMVGAHERGFNDTHIGIALAGWFDKGKDIPTLAQLTSLFALVRLLIQTYNWDLTPTSKCVRFHHESDPGKTCPGTLWQGLKVDFILALRNDNPAWFLKRITGNEN